MEPAAQALATEYFVPLSRLMADAVADESLDDVRRATSIIRRLCGAVTDARVVAS
jgi:hypothetical protein